MESNKFNIVHITSEFSQKNFSITSLIVFLIHKINNFASHKIFIETKQLETNLPANVQFLLFKNKWLDFFNIKNKIIAYNVPNTIFHLHGLWSPLQLYSFFLLIYLNIPTVVHAHGMLLESALKENGYIKKLVKNFVLFLFNYASQNRRVAFVAITKEETFSILKHFPSLKVFSLPNPIPFETNTNNKKSYNRNKKIFVFFGRIHPHKNIENIIHSFNKSKLSKECYLHIYGIEDDQKYLQKLKSLIQHNKKIKIFKPVFGNTKLKVMKSAWINILLSKSEVLSFSLLESGLNGLPTLVNENFHLPNYDNITIKVRSNEASIIKKLKEISNWSEIFRDSIYKKSTNFFNKYQKTSEKFCIDEIKNIYKLSIKSNTKIISNFYTFLSTSIIYGFNFFLPSSMVVFFYLSGNAEVAAESGLFIILCTSITQVLSSNMRSLSIANKLIKVNLDNFFIFRFLFSILYILILFFILPIWKLQYPSLIFFLSSTILLQWIFETELVKIELTGNNIKLFILLICYSILGLTSTFLAINNNVFALNWLLILFCLYIFGISLKKFFFLIKKINMYNLLFYSFKKYTKNYLYSALLSSFSLVFSGLFWRFSIYYLFEKSIAGLLFAGFTLGSFSGTLFNIILGPAYLKANIKIGKKIKYLISFIFFIILFLNINIYFNLEYNYDVLKDYVLNVDKLFYIVAIHSMLGSFFMTYSMYQRHKMIFHQNRKQEIFIKDFIYNFIISALFLLLYWLNNIDGVAHLYLISSLIAVIMYKVLPNNFYKK